MSHLNTKKREMERYDSVDKDRGRSVGSVFDHDYYHTLAEHGHWDKLDSIFGAEIDESSRVLDLGCGTATKSARRVGAEDVERFVGLDISLAELRRGKANEGTEAVAFVGGDAEQLPFPEDSFDVVIALAALHHLPDWEGTIHAEIRRILTNDGVLIFSEPAKYNPFYFAFRLVFESRERTEAERPLSPFKVRRTLNSTFEDLRLECSYIVSATIPAFQSLLRFDIPKRLMLSLYDAERVVLNNGGYPLAGHMVGVAHSPA